MTPAQLNAWVAAIAGLANTGVAIGGLVRGLLPQAHPELSPEELAAAYEAIMTEDTVRAALARQAAGEV